MSKKTRFYDIGHHEHRNRDKPEVNVLNQKETDRKPPFVPLFMFIKTCNSSLVEVIKCINQRIEGRGVLASQA